MTDQELDYQTMSFDQFLVKADRTPYPDDWRKGQFYFNFMHEVRPDVANQLRGSIHDCFYRDEKLSDFLKAARELW